MILQSPFDKSIFIYTVMNIDSHWLSVYEYISPQPSLEIMHEYGWAVVPEPIQCIGLPPTLA